MLSQLEVISSLYEIPPRRYLSYVRRPSPYFPSRVERRVVFR
jgi:hypothetical protein